MKRKSLVFSRGITRIPSLHAFLPECDIITYSPFTKTPANCILGWGLRPSTQKARAYASRHGLPFVALEDGFLRSVGLGVESYPPFSLVVDELGIYYDTTRPSGLEQLILSEIGPDLLVQAERAVQQIVAYKLSKYNHAPDFDRNFVKQKPIVLVIDQTFGDMAVKYGQADESQFMQMLQAAIAENPDSEIWVKTHPDVISGKKKGYLTQLPELSDKVHLFAQDCNPLTLLNVVDKVYCVTSQMGFEALMLGKPVITFGVPWFAGWGVTDDRHSAISALQHSQRRQPRSFLHLFAAAYLQYSRYINPNTGERSDIFAVIAYLHQMRVHGERMRGTLYCVGMSLWKQAVIKPFFRLPQCQLVFTSLKRLQKIAQNQPLASHTKILIWGSGKPEVLDFAKQNALPVLRMEDGFIRSVGLGSNLVAPLSLVVDDLGIYFNAEIPSRLEHILQYGDFTEEDLTTAELLRQQLIANHIGKYNVGASGFNLPKMGKTTILVPGQVEDDASIQLGSPHITKNLDLLKAVRANNPDAYIIYKPHPDVVSGNRIGQIDPSLARQYADDIVENANILDCIMQVDEVHTMTSLAGFEALLRGKVVHCYGLPFYSNWGLTSDELKLDRRTRQLTLLALLSAVLNYYPLYVSPQTGQFVDAKTAIRLLKAQRESLQHDGFHRSWLAKQWGKLKQLCKALF